MKKLSKKRGHSFADNKLVIACDVGKDELDAYCELGRQSVQDSFTNHALQIADTDTVITAIALGPRNLGDCQSKIRLRRKE